MKRPLLVTDPGLASLPMVEQAVASCNRAGLACAVFSNIKGNPTGANVEAGVNAFRQGRPDGVIAFGGGSGRDAGKARPEERRVGKEGVRTGGTRGARVS